MNCRASGNRLPLISHIIIRISDTSRPSHPVLFGLVVIASVLPAGKAQFVQQGIKLVGTGGVGVAQQGIGVALSGDGNTAVVGGFGDNVQSGAVWVYTRSGGVWTQQGGKLVGTDSVGDAGQGQSVALSEDGNTAIIGGPGDNGNAGAAWVFTRSSGVWARQGRKLVGTGSIAGAGQGRSVALSGDGNTAVVGGPGDRGNAGAAWVFTRSGGVWTQQGGKLVGTGAVGNALQGSSVALSGDGNTVALGGLVDNGVEGQHGFYYGAGATWVFTRSGGVWTQQGNKLIGTGAIGNADQGSSVAVSGDGNTVIVGGPFDNGGIGQFALSYGAGAAWVFTRSGGVWTQQGNKLTGLGAAGSADQGSSVALSGDGNTAVIGGPFDNGNIGAAWVYTRSDGVWAQLSNKLVGTGAIAVQGSLFGAFEGGSVAVSTDGNTAILGGDDDNNFVGAAWVFVNMPATTAKPAITSVVNAAGFTAGGAISAGSWVTIFGTGLAPMGDSRTWNAATEIVNGILPVATRPIPSRSPPHLFGCIRVHSRPRVFPAASVTFPRRTSRTSPEDRASSRRPDGPPRDSGSAATSPVPR